MSMDKKQKKIVKIICLISLIALVAGLFAPLLAGQSF